MINATFVRQYRRKTDGKLVFVYRLKGDKKALAEYKKTKGEHYVEDSETKDPLFFTTRLAGAGGPLRKTEKDYVIDTSEMDQIKNLQDQGYSFEAASAFVQQMHKATKPAATADAEGQED
jgi:hypothetical protein